MLRGGRPSPPGPQGWPASTGAAAAAPALGAGRRRSGRSWAKAGGGLALTDYETLAAAEGGEEVVAGFEHVVLVDPPTSADAAALMAAGDSGYLHELWSEAEHEFALAALDESLASRASVAAA